MTLEQFLRWDVDVAGAGYAEQFERRAEDRLSMALGIVRAQAPAFGELLIALVSDLPEDRVLRIAQAPELEFQLRLVRTEAGRPEGLALFLGKAFEAELAAASRECRPREDALEVDFESPFNRGDVVKRFPVYGMPPAERWTALSERLEGAIGLLDRGASRAALFTRRFTKVVVPISVPNLESGYGSFSSSWYPGRTVLVNPDMAGGVELTSALLHEAIHSLIDVSEIGGSLIAEGESGACLVTSPWTGAQISLQSLMDAYFVWYGLLWFWLLARENGTTPSRDANRLIRLCGRGFRPEVAEVVGDRLPVVHETTRGAIESLRRAVLAEAPVVAGR